MPTSTKSRRVQARNTTTDTAQEGTVTTATDTATDNDTTPEFSFEVESAPADFEPTRRSPGRQRRPSPFDTVLRDPKVFGKGWKQVPFDSEEHKSAIVAELNRAKQHLGVGLDLDTNDEKFVFFKSRELQKRERKASTNGEALSEQDGDEGDSDE